MRYLILLFLMPFLLASSCRGSKHSLQSEKGKKVRFEIKNLQKKKGDCESPNNACTQVDLTFPIVTEGVQQVKQAINDTIYKVLIQSVMFENYEGEHTNDELEKQTDNFINEWQKERNLENGSADVPGWEVTVSGEVGLHTPKVAVITLGNYSYVGGAHPNSYLSIYNFDLEDGSILRWEDVVTDLEAVKALAADAFREARQLPKDTDLTEAGYFWGEPFALPQNFELQEEGIFFWYNPYEAASYAEGPTDFIITYDKLKDLVRKNRIF